MSRNTALAASDDTSTDSVNAPQSDETANADTSTETTNSDKATYTSEMVNLDNAVELYKSAPNGKDRAIVRKAVETAKDVAIDNLDIDAALRAKSVLSELRVTPKTPEKASLTAAEAVNVRIAVLVKSALNVASGRMVPDGLDVSEVDFDTFTPIAAVLTELSALCTVPEKVTESDLVDMIEKVSKSRITRSSEKHDIGDVVRRAFDGRKVGDVLKPSEIARYGAFGDYKPGTGAIAARFTVGNGVAGFEFDRTVSPNIVRYVAVVPVEADSTDSD